MTRTRMPALLLAVVLAAGVLVAVPGTAASAAAVGDYLYDHQWGSRGDSIFSAPADVVIDPAGNVFVADVDRITKHSPTGAFIAAFGESGPGAVGDPSGIAVDSGGRVFVSDASLGKVLKFANDGTFIASFGSSGSGAGQLSSPSAIAVDTFGDVFVADSVNDSVSRFSNAGVFLSTVATGGSDPDELDGPSGLVFTSDGTLYVADSGHASIKYFERSGTAGAYVYSYFNQWGTSGTGTAQFIQPGEMATDGATIYIADTGNERVQRYQANGTYLSTWTQASVGDQPFGSVTGIAVDPSGNILVADPVYKRVVRVSVISGNEWSVTYPTMAGQFHSSAAVQTDATGNVYVVDRSNNRVQKFDASGRYLTQWGTTGFDSGQFVSPMDIALDGRGHVFVVDEIQNRVQVFSESGAYLGRFGTAGTGNGQFAGPNALDVDAAGNIYVLDAGNYRVQKFAASTYSYVAQFGTYGYGAGQMSSPFGLTVSANGLAAYVVDAEQDHLLRFTSPTGASYSYADTVGANGTAPGQLDTPTGADLDGAGNVWVADAFNARVQKFSPSGSFVTAFGSSGAADGQFSYPSDVAVAANGDVIVADTTLNRVQVFKQIAAPSVTSAHLGAGQVGVPYSGSVVASAYPPATIAVASGLLPAGLALNSVTGAITGVPTTVGTTTFAVVASNAYGVSAAAFLSIGIAPGVLRGSVAVTGTPAIGKTVKIATTGFAPGVHYTQKWLRNGKPIAKATGSTYKLKKTDLNKKISVVVTASLANYTTASATSKTITAKYAFKKAATPKVTGMAKVGKKLSVRVGRWSPKAKTTVRWYRNGVAIPKATKLHYTLKKADRGAKITVTVTAKKKNYLTTVKTSKTTGAVKK